MVVVFPAQLERLSHKDREFIMSILGTDAPTRHGLEVMMADPDSLEIILDNKTLQGALLDRLSRTEVSTQFEFYLLIRPALQRLGLDDRDVAHYLAALLASFAYAERTPDVLPKETFQLDYLAKMICSLRHTNDEGRFMVLSYMGNYALLLGGLFPEKLPQSDVATAQADLAYCDRLGTASYRAAANQPMAWEYMVQTVYVKLADRFHEARLALSDLAEQGIFSGQVA